MGVKILFFSRGTLGQNSMFPEKGGQNSIFFPSALKKGGQNRGAYQPTSLYVRQRHTLEFIESPPGQCVSYDELVYVGDMNCAHKKSNTIQTFCDMYSLSDRIKAPTCFKGKEPNLLEVILVSNPKRYAGTVNCDCPVNDVHNCIGVATKRHNRLYHPRKIYYRSYKYFDDEKFADDITSAPFHVAEIFDDVDDMSSYVSTLLGNIIDSHAPLKCKNIKYNSVPFMNSQLRKAMYKRNMARNKFRKNGRKYWEEHRRQRNKTVAIRKKSIANYFAKNCARKDKRFWSTVSPFMTDKKCKNSSNISLQNDGKIVVCEKKYPKSLMIISVVLLMVLDLTTISQLRMQ